MTPEPPITATQRAYLQSFDRWLRAPSPQSTQERQQRLGTVCAEADVRPPGRPEQHDEKDSAHMAADAPRPTKVVLAGALAELQAREAKLKRLERELAENRAAIKILRKLVGEAPVRVASAPAGELAAVPAIGTGEDRDELVLRVIAAEQPCARGVLLRRSGLPNGALKTVIDRLRDAGKVQMVGQKAGARYVLTENPEQSEAA